MLLRSLKFKASNKISGFESVAPVPFTREISMVVEMVHLKGGIGGIVHPPNGSIYHLYTTYSPCLLGGETCYRSHLLGEPETNIENLIFLFEKV